MQPLSAIFTPLKVSLGDGVRLLRDVVRKQHLSYLGSGYVKQRTAAGLKITRVVKGTPGEAPDVPVEGVDGLSFPIQVSSPDRIEEFIAALTVEPEHLTLRIVFDSPAIDSNGWSAWAMALMAETVSTFDLEMGIVDFSERIAGDPFINLETFDARLRQAQSLRPRFPLAAVARDSISKPARLLRREPLNCRVVHMTGGPIAFTCGFLDLVKASHDDYSSD